MVHNEYGIFTGEEAAVENISRLLAEKGHDVIRFARSSAEIPNMHFGKIRAFFSGIYSFSSKRAMRRLLAEHKPDIMHVHNFWIILSPSIFCAARDAGVATVLG